MALIFADGFDHYAAADVLKKWTGLNTSTVLSDISISPTYARPPGGMGIIPGGAAASRGIYKTFTATYVSFVSGFNILFPNTLAINNSFWAVYDSTSGSPGATFQLDLRGDGAGHLVIHRGAASGGTAIATSTNVFSTNTWYHIEIKATINSTTGAYEVKVNGSSVGWLPAATNQNTRGQSSNNLIDVVGILSTSVLCQFDDFYFLSSSSPNSDFIGPQKIITCFPAGAGNYAQWTGNYAANFANVQELSADGDQTFNQSSTANQKDTFVFDDVPSGTVAAIQHTIEARQDAGAARTMRAIQRTSTTDYNGTTQNLTGSYLFYTDPKDQDPSTSSAWAASGFNGSEFGYELVS